MLCRFLFFSNRIEDDTNETETCFLSALLSAFAELFHMVTKLMPHSQASTNPRPLAFFSRAFRLLQVLFRVRFLHQSTTLWLIILKPAEHYSLQDMVFPIID